MQVRSTHLEYKKLRLKRAYQRSDCLSDHSLFLQLWAILPLYPLVRLNDHPEVLVLIDVVAQPVQQGTAAPIFICPKKFSFRPEGIDT